MSVGDAVTWLFVPGSRPDRFEKAVASGADEVVLDLEDAVAPDSKDEARSSVAGWLGTGGSGWVRVNAAGTAGHEDDLAAISGRGGLRGVMVPRAEDPAAVAAVRAFLPVGVGVVALVESALGLDRSIAMARSGAVDRLAFGSIDFALDIGADETDEALLLARSSLVLASRLGGLPPPLDGVTAATGDADAAHAAAARARALGFGGKLCLHPQQVGPVEAGFRPTTRQVAWATRVLETADEGTGAVLVDGEMVDRPVIARARSIVARSIVARDGVRP